MVLSNSRNSCVRRDPKNHVDLLRTEGLWKEDTLREYFAYIHTLQPKLTKEAEMVLRATYLYHRSHPDRREERTTVRLLDSLLRQESVLLSNVALKFLLIYF